MHMRVFTQQADEKCSGRFFYLNLMQFVFRTFRL